MRNGCPKDVARPGHSRSVSRLTRPLARLRMPVVHPTPAAPRSPDQEFLPAATRLESFPESKSMLDPYLRHPAPQIARIGEGRNRQRRKRRRRVRREKQSILSGDDRRVRPIQPHGSRSQPQQPEIHAIQVRREIRLRNPAAGRPWCARPPSCGPNTSSPICDCRNVPPKLPPGRARRTVVSDTTEYRRCSPFPHC